MSALPFVAALPFLLIGLHLMRVSRRSGAVPDRLLSAFFLLIGIGVVPRMTAVDLATSGAGRSWAVFCLNSAADLVIGSALVCLAAFAWQVFRPEAAWAKKLVIAFAVSLGAAFAAGAISLGASGGSGPIAVVFNCIGAAVLFWAFAECLLYYQRMRRRRALGMIDPVVANRFLLWSIWTGAITLQATFTAILRSAMWWSGAGEMLAEGLDPGGSWLAIIQAAKGVLILIAPTAVVSVYLSFSPPAGYRRWLQSRQPGFSHA